jgi:diaminopimelate decarboxylase
MSATDQATTMDLMAVRPSALAPLLDPAIDRFLQTSPQPLFDLVSRHGSPLNIVWPNALMANAAALSAVLREHGLRFKLFYGAKVNKSQALVRAAVSAGIGVDVSSVYELRDALRAGAEPSRLCATGPAKTAAFHAELVGSGALIAVDSAEELADLEAWLRIGASVRRARVLLRYRPAAYGASRFGMGRDQMLHCLDQMAVRDSPFAFEGFHFHLSGYDDATRVQALRELVPLIETAGRRGLRPRMIDIGGGLPIQYVDGDSYDAFLENQKRSHYRNGKIPTSFYPYGGRIPAVAWLRRFLGAAFMCGMTVSEYLKARDLTLALEPGRSLVDQAAITVFRVTRTKPVTDDHHVIFVEGSSFSACETWCASEFLVDPILLRHKRHGAAGRPVRAYIAGHSCLDDDVVTNRLLHFEVPPRQGDLLIYANTAGYQMDLLENEFHRHPMPRRLTACSVEGSAVTFTPDE